MNCYHCGDECKNDLIEYQDKPFCCMGCKTVYEIIHDNNLDTYYSLEDNPGYKIGKIQRKDKYDYLDQEEIKNRFLIFDDEGVSKISFSIPQIHCSSCIWLLENLHRLASGITYSVVDFPKRRADITFDNTQISLREVVELLVTIGYEPDLSVSEKSVSKTKTNHTLLYKLGVAGFCFGNIMLLSFPEYFGIGDEFARFKRFFGYLSLLLSLPVLLYAGQDYIISAFKGIKQRFINIDIPIALGMITLFARSTYEVISGTGAGYFDSLSGLVFFLILGRWFQQKTYDALSFERDYKSYFPIAVKKQIGDKTISTVLEDLKVDDIIEIRNEELIPCDGHLLSGTAHIDYSFVTGESELVKKNTGDLLYAGGRQVGSIIQVKLSKEVNNSYLTQLWNQEAFQKNNSQHDLNSMVNKVSKHFTLIILGITLLTAIYWWFVNPAFIWKTITAVLIVACPCALALSVPFTFGNLTRIMGRYGLYVKNTNVIEKMANLSHVILDKTGTITNSKASDMTYHGEALTSLEKSYLKSCTSNSTHPLSQDITRYFDYATICQVDAFQETSGKGIEATIDHHFIQVGSSSFVNHEAETMDGLGSKIYVSIDHKYKGYFLVRQQYREELQNVVSALNAAYDVQLLSGDNDSQKEVLRDKFGMHTMHFDQSPMDKLIHIKTLQDHGAHILMLGDGLNDAGALKQSDVGIAISDSVNQFSPSCDAILDANQFHNLNAFINLSKKGVVIIYASFAISFLYNIVGMGFAITGNLSPVIAAILMPLSSISVVLFTTITTNLLSKTILKN